MNDEMPENCCEASANDFNALQDTLYVIGGKWRIPVLYSIYMGNKRFREIERNIPGITTRVLSKELKLMELNKLIKRTVHTDRPASIEYTCTEYSESLADIIEAMINWGVSHKQEIKK